MKNILLLIITLRIFGCENNIATHNEKLIQKIVDEIRLGWENGDGTPFRKHFLDWDGARYIEGNFAWAVVDTEIKLTTTSGRKIHNKGHGRYLLQWVNGGWKVVHIQSASKPV